jgi:general secretion pathway protein G
MKRLSIRTRPRLRTRAGFSLAELMVVIVIIALLATFVAQNALPNLLRAKVTKAKSDIATLSSALDNYALNNGGQYPDSLEPLVTPDEYGNRYLKDQTTVPLDPWKNMYVYEPPSGSSMEFRVISYGSDGQPGGEGDETDIDNFTIRENK